LDNSRSCRCSVSRLLLCILVVGTFIFAQDAIVRPNDALILENIPAARGSVGYGKTFTQLDNVFLRENAYKDIGVVFDWIEAQAELDAKRAMVTGGSSGGHMTLAAATLYNDRIACSVMWSACRT
jgi:dienelactone hydrolase